MPCLDRALLASKAQSTFASYHQSFIGWLGKSIFASSNQSFVGF